MTRPHLRAVCVTLAVCFLAAVTPSKTQAAFLAQWTFESSIPTAAGPYSPEVGTGSALGQHANGSTVYSSPVGNGSAHSFSSNMWSVGDYYQFSTSTLGYTDITISWDQTNSATGPRDFKLSYSTDGTNFTGFGATYSVTQITWSSNPASANSASTFTRDLSSITALNNQATVYFRLSDISTTAANGMPVGTGGTNRVDNFSISGTQAVNPVPAPSAVVLLSTALPALIVLRRRFGV